MAKNVSERFQLSRADLNKWANNTLLFLAPLGLIYLGMVILNVREEGFEVNDLIPNQVTFGAMVLYVANTLFDLLKKFVSENTYSK